MATVNDMMKKTDKNFQNIELLVTLRRIITHEDKSKITFIFFSPKVHTEYKKNYNIGDIKGRVDFNRAMFALGCNSKNYDVWLDKIIHEKIEISVSINQNGFIRYIKVLPKESKEFIKKGIFLGNIEGLTKDDRTFLMTLSLDVLKKEFGRQ